MIDTNHELEKKYFAALSTLPIPVYNSIVPDGENPDNYLVFRVTSNADIGTKNSSDVEVVVNIDLYTTLNMNNPTAVAQLANDVFAKIYPGNGAIVLDGVQLVSTKLTMDMTETISVNNNIRLQSRKLQFTHHIYQHDI